MNRQMDLGGWPKRPPHHCPECPPFSGLADYLIENRDGARFSVWAVYSYGRVCLVEFTENNARDIHRIELPV